MSLGLTARVRAVALTGVAALALAALAACGSNDSTPSGDDSASANHDPYVWGMDVELSGVVSYYGQTMQQGLQAYIDQVNAQGGINGHPIKLTSLDNAGDASKAAADATQLVSADKAIMMFGGVLSSSCSGAQPVVDRYKVPMACLSVAEADPYLYSLGADNTRPGTALVSAAKDVSKLSNPKVAFAYLNTLTDIELSKTIGDKASAAGVDIVTSQQIDIAATDVSAQVAKIVAAKPDVALVSETGPGLLMVLKALRSSGFNGPVVWLDGGGNMSLVASVKDQNLYAFNPYQLIDPNGTDEAVQNYISAVTGKIKDTKSVIGLNGGDVPYGYITATAVGDALKACGYPCSGEQLKAQLDQTNLSLPGLIDSFQWTADDHYPYKNWYLYKTVGADSTFVQSYPSD